MKKINFILLSLVVCALLALNIPVEEKTPPAIEEKENLETPIPTTPTAQPLDKQEGESMMKPAWYRYFNPHTVEVKSEKEQAVLQFTEGKPNPSPQFTNYDLVNTSDKTVRVRTQNGSLIMIQEALDKKGKWRPIEYWNYDWGMGSVFDYLELAPKEAILVSVPRYTGDFETQIRLKIKTGEAKEDTDVYYSAPFTGKIDPNQFKIEPDRKTDKISYLGAKE